MARYQATRMQRNLGKNLFSSEVKPITFHTLAVHSPLNYRRVRSTFSIKATLKTERSGLYREVRVRVKSPG